MAATNIGTAYVQILPTTEGIQEKLTETLSSSGSSAAEVAGESMGGTLTEKLSGALSSGAGAIGDALKTALSTAVDAVTDFGENAVKAGSDFDEAMQNVAATMGVNATDILNLRELAKDLGSSTQYTAEEAAEALGYMAQAGFDTKKSMDALPKVLDLAASGTMDLAEASGMVTNLQSALGLNEDQTQELVDKMATMAANSNTSVQQLGDALLTIGATGKDAYDGIDELTSLIGVLGDSGIQASEAGTHLRNIILKLKEPSEKGAEALEKLGMSYDDMYDASGKMKDVRTIITQMATAMEGMDEKSRTAVTNGLFNTTDLAAVNTLLNTSVERWDELEDKLDNSAGSAKEMAKTKLDSLSGDVTTFQSAVEGAYIAVSEKLNPILREFVQTGTEGIQNITKAFEEDGFAGAAEEFSTWVTDAATKIEDQLPQMQEAAHKVLKAITDGLAEKIPSMTESAKAILANLGEELEFNNLDLLESFSNLLSDVFNMLAELIPDTMELATKIVLQIADSIINETKDGGMLESAENILTGIMDGISESLTVLTDIGIEILMGISDSILENVPYAVTSIPDVVDGLVNALLEGVEDIANGGADLIAHVADHTDDIIDSVKKTIPKIIKGLGKAFKEHGPDIAEAGQKLFCSLLDNGSEIIIELAKEVPGLVVDLGNLVIENAPEMLDAGIELINSIGDGVEEGAQKAFENANEALKETFGVTIPQMIENIKDALKEQYDNMAQAGLDLLKSLLNKLEDAIEYIKEAGPEIVNGIIEAIKEEGQKMIDAGWDLIVGFKDGIVNGAKGAADAAGDMANGVITSVTGIFEIGSPSKVFKRIGSYLVEGMTKGIEENEQTPVNSIASLGQKIIDAIKKKFDERSPSHVFQQIGTYLDEGLTSGIEDGQSGPISAIQKLASDVENAFNPRLAIDSAVSSGSSLSASGYSPYVAEHFGNAYTGAQRDTTVVLALDGRELARTTVPYINQENKRIGVRFA